MKIVLIAILLLTCKLAYGQSSNVIYNSSSTSNCQIVRANITDSATYVFLKYTFRKNQEEQLFVNDETYLIIENNERKYLLINSINIPFSPSYHLGMDSSVIYFALVFESIPAQTKFNLISPKFTFDGIKINTQDQFEKIDYIGLFEQFPIKEKGYFYKNGNLVQYAVYKGYVISMTLTSSDQFKNHSECYVSIENHTNKRVDFFPERMSGYLNDYKEPVSLMSYEEYSQKVARKQAATTFFVALGEYADARGAGNTTTTSQINERSSSMINGSFGSYNNYVDLNMRTYSNSTINTTQFSNSAQYFANQNAKNNVNNLVSNFLEIQNAINEGYLKTNTIFPNSRINGFFSFDSKRSNYLKITVPLGKESFEFEWPVNTSSSDDITEKVTYFGQSISPDSLRKFFNDLTSQNKVDYLTEYNDVSEVKKGDIVKLNGYYDDDNIEIQYGIILEVLSNKLVSIKYATKTEIIETLDSYKKIKKVHLKDL